MKEIYYLGLSLSNIFTCNFINTFLAAHIKVPPDETSSYQNGFLLPPRLEPLRTITHKQLGYLKDRSVQQRCQNWGGYLSRGGGNNRVPLNVRKTLL